MGSHLKRRTWEEDVGVQDTSYKVLILSIHLNQKMKQILHKIHYVHK